MSEVRESVIEAAVRDYAKATGWLVYKFVSPGSRAVPDRLFVYRSVVIFGEIKRENEKPSRQQRIRINELRKAGANVFWWSTFEAAKKRLDQYRAMADEEWQFS